MEQTFRLMSVTAHPDDESLGFGGTMAKYAAEGIETTLVTATRGERGWVGDPLEYPGPWELGRIREQELHNAATALGISRVVFLDEMDGEINGCASSGLTAKITAEIRRHRPDVVVTFGPDGVYGHPDHIAISQQTTAAVLAAADPSYDLPGSDSPHRVSKLYYRIWTAAEESTYRSVLGDVAIKVDGLLRRWVSWPEWAVSARLDTADYWSEVSEAVACHQSQIGGLTALTMLSARDRRVLWGSQHYYRAMSIVDVSPHVERDLFAGVRPETRRMVSHPENTNGTTRQSSNQ